MITAAAYGWIKALHVASIIAFVAGVLSQSLFLATHRDDTSAIIAHRFHRAERGPTTIALVLALVSGVTIAAIGHWFQAVWLLLKVLLVILLFAFHGLQSGQLLRLAAGQSVSSRPLQHAVLAIASIIAVLAVLKPSLL